MNEIDITDIITSESFHTRELSNSIANSGLQNIGQATWNNANEKAKEELIQKAFKDIETEGLMDYFREYGAWTDGELLEHGKAGLISLTLQFIASDLQEAGIEDWQDVESFDWQQYEEDCQAGQLSGNLFKGDDGRIYFSLYH